jgi:hypothetical protein
MTSEARTTLAKNVRKLIANEAVDGSPVSIRAWSMSKGLDTRLIDRIVKGENAVTVDTLGIVAANCGVPAWQLLHPDFDPTATPMTGASAEDVAFLKKLRTFMEGQVR